MQAVIYEKSNSPHALVLREVFLKRKIFGSDKAGRVELVGKNSRQFAVGAEVFGDISACNLEGVAEYVSVTKTRWL